MDEGLNKAGCGNPNEAKKKATIGPLHRRRESKTQTFFHGRSLGGPVNLQRGENGRFRPSSNFPDLMQNSCRLSHPYLFWVPPGLAWDFSWGQLKPAAVEPDRRLEALAVAIA